MYFFVNHEITTPLIFIKENLSLKAFARTLFVGGVKIRIFTRREIIVDITEFMNIYNFIITTKLKHYQMCVNLMRYYLSIPLEINEKEE